MGDHDTPQHQDILERRKQTDCANHEKRLIGVEHTSESIKGVMESLNTKVDLILAQITKVAVLEERHSTQQIDLTRAHRKIEMIEAAHDHDMVEARGFISEARGMAKMFGWIATIIGSTVIILLVKVLFFMGAHGATI